MMSLRARVLVAVALVLAISVAVGLVFAGWLERGSLRDELGAGLKGGLQTIQTALAEPAAGSRSGRPFRQLIATFDGNRHVSAVLIAADGRAVEASRPFRSAHAAPGWFSGLLDPRLAPGRIVLPASPEGYAAILLTPAPEDDVGDAWLQFCDVLAVLAFACVSGFGLVYLTIGQALRPLADLSKAFVRVGSGDYSARVGEGGPTDVRDLARGFNSMAGELAAMQTRNRGLEDQLLRLQDEERADLARDLHDEIGPHLFSVNVDATMIDQLVAQHRVDEIPAQVRAIHAGVAHMQKLVREILGRLRPTPVVELGLDAAIDDLVAFWRARRPDIVFDIHLDLDEARLSDAVEETLYRVVQEGLSNAVRHGRPGRIAIVVTPAGARELLVQVSDDGAPEAAPAERAATGGTTGFGLIGMRERVEACGGVLEVGRADAGGGWSVAARLPARGKAAAEPAALSA